MNDDDLIAFADEEVAHRCVPGASWVVLVVDDEPSVHEVTALVLAELVLDGRGVDFLHASSAGQAQALLGQRDDVAVVLLDVVMETETAGLDLVARIRHESLSPSTRIVIRTGQAGAFSEHEVLRQFDVNEYCHKTDMTDRVLNRICLLALRNYRDILTARSLP
ncbi:response regulator [Paucibacter sp. TC2R-5]|uniref:response regulator n=1 Tax=Paucibacter sp. TC2R-5 TaxID=2893555 RepID=UPI0021E3B02D|nr:response regulator [Paucibacter sp. TC2R-5]MCV2360158.1 response regulator [Paucibacter sp. TC2R-5]